MYTYVHIWVHMLHTQRPRHTAPYLQVGAGAALPAGVEVHGQRLAPAGGGGGSAAGGRPQGGFSALPGIAIGSPTPWEGRAARPLYQKKGQFHFFLEITPVKF